MKTYYIKITETLERTVEVHADNVDEAIEKVEEACNNDEVELDWQDFVDREVQDFTEETEYNYELGGMPKFYEVK